METKYILFDNDGVLVDTEKFYFRATKEVLSGIGIELTQNRYLQLQAKGESGFDLAEADGVPAARINQLRTQRNDLYQKYITTEQIELPGVVETIKQLRRKYKMAIVSTARPEDFELIHTGRSILQYMDFALTAGDYVKHKPEPEPYLAALKRFDAKPAEAVVVEDSQRGLESAYRAGIGCYIISNEFTQNQDFTKAKAVLDSIGELPAALTAHKSI